MLGKRACKPDFPEVPDRPETPEELEIPDILEGRKLRKNRKYRKLRISRRSRIFRKTESLGGLELSHGTLNHVSCARAVADIFHYHLGVINGFTQLGAWRCLLLSLAEQRQ